MDEHATASPWAAAVRLGLVVSAVAAAVAVAISAFGDVSQTALVIAVIVVGFVVSWIHTGRAVEAVDQDAPPPHETVVRGQGPRAATRRESRHARVR